MGTAYHPQSDGQTFETLTERTNRILEEVLRHYVRHVAPNQADWDEKLTLVEFVLNNSYNASTGSTPSCLNYGQHPCMPTIAAVDVPQFPGIERFTREMQ